MNRLLKASLLFAFLISTITAVGYSFSFASTNEELSHAVARLKSDWAADIKAYDGTSADPTHGGHAK